MEMNEISWYLRYWSELCVQSTFEEINNGNIFIEWIGKIVIINNKNRSIYIAQLLFEFILLCLKVKISFGNAPLSKNEMEALITNHVKEYVFNNTWWYKFCRETAY